MSYETVVNAIKTVILSDASMPDFDENDVLIGDYDMFNGSHRYGVVIDYAAMKGERAEMGSSFYHDWTIQLTLGVPFTTAQRAHDEIMALREHVMGRIGANPQLDIASNLINAEVAAGNSMDDLVEFGNGIWMMETLTVAVRELREY